MDVFFNPYTLAAAALGYLLGSIPFGYLLTRAAGLGDVREVGSGNIGATNVLRTGHKGLAALTLLLDALKGTAAVLIGHWIGAHGGVAILASLLAGLAAFLGHVFPVWLGFRGGKGVATYIGVLLGVDWRAAIGFCARVAAGRRVDALFLAVGARRRGHRAPRPVRARRPRYRPARGDSCRRSSSTSTAPTSAVSRPERSRGSVPKRDPAPAASLNDAERLAALRLARSENVGPVTFRELLKHYGSRHGGARRPPAAVAARRLSPADPRLPAR